MEKILENYLNRISVYNDKRFDAITSLLEELNIPYIIQKKENSFEVPIYGEVAEPQEKDSCYHQMSFMDYMSERGDAISEDYDKYFSELDEESDDKCGYDDSTYQEYEDYDNYKEDDIYEMLEGLSVEEIEALDNDVFNRFQKDDTSDNDNNNINPYHMFQMMSHLWRPRKVIGYREEHEIIRNIIIPLTQYYDGEYDEKLVFMAHYDAVHGSTGANDNGSSVAILISMCKKLVDSGTINIPVEVVFTDREETGGLGCKMYLEQYGHLISEVINLDTCGVGVDVIVDDRSWHPNYITTPLQDGWYNEGTKQVIFVEKLPYCDSDIVFSKGLPIMTICTLPGDDVLSIMCGRPSYHETYKYMHNGSCDSIGYINYETMANILDYVSQIFEITV